MIVIVTELLHQSVGVLRLGETLFSIHPALKKIMILYNAVSVITLIALSAHSRASNADSLGKTKLIALFKHLYLKSEPTKSFLEVAINRLKLNLCLSNMRHDASNYLHVMAICIGAVSTTRYSISVSYLQFSAFLIKELIYQAKNICLQKIPRDSNDKEEKVV